MRLRRLVLSSTVLANILLVGTAGAEAPPAVSLPSAPAMPEVPKALAGRVKTVGKQIQRVQEQCEDTGERNPGRYDRRCPAWLASIRSSGEAAVFAIAGPALGDGQESLDFADARDTESELFAALTDSKSDAAVVALLRRLHRTASADDGDPSATRILDALGLLTGYDAKAYVPSWYSSEDKAWHVDAATQWITWYEAHRNEGHDAWAKAGVMRARGWLDSKDIDERSTAIRRLLRPDGDKVAALASLVGVLSDPDLVGDQTWDFEAVARTAGLSNDGIAEAATARRKVLIARGDANALEEQAAIERRAQATVELKTCKEALSSLRTDDALAACKKATSLDDTSVEALVSLGWAQFEAGQLDDAAATAVTVVDLLIQYERSASDAAIGYTLLAAVKTMQGQLDEAKEALHNAGGGGGSPEIVARRALLSGKAPPAAWVRTLAPAYYCFEAKSAAAATDYLARRGATNPEVLRKAIARIGQDQRASLMAEGASVCPWKVEISGAMPAM